MVTSQRVAVIITALPVEREAVVEHLREVGEEPELRGSIYRRGIFDDRSEPWKVIVAEIGAGNEGAAAEAERVIAHYSPQVALFVGVAGAIKDLAKGDVVASTKVYAYESGKDQPGGFRPRPSVQLPSYALEQRARHEAGEQAWRQRIKGVGYTGQTATLVAKVSPIAAGEKVLASNRSQIFKFIRATYGDALAVEMEGHGFLLGVRMNQPTQGMVVRSISDCLSDKDEANDENWQPVAARHAAAFAFQVLAKLPLMEGAPASRSQSALAAGISQVLSLEPSGSDNWVRFIGDKYKRNSEFSVTAQFHLLIGPVPVSLLGLEGRYFAQGCSSLAREPSLRIDGESIDFAPDWDNLRRPRHFGPGETGLVEYARPFWPPLTVMCAVDCDFGDLEIRVRYRAGNELSTAAFVFELRPGGRMLAVSRVRDVPQVSDACLKDLHARARLTKDQFDALMGYPPEHRYRAAHSDNTSREYLEVLDVHRNLLRTIVGKPGLFEPG
jgi:nucleoside phosphorylase